MAALTGALYLGAALTMNTLAPVMTKITQNESGGYSYNKWCVYFFAELIKLVVASVWSLHLKKTGARTPLSSTCDTTSVRMQTHSSPCVGTDPSAASKMTLNGKESARYVGPVRRCCSVPNR